MKDPFTIGYEPSVRIVRYNGVPVGLIYTRDGARVVAPVLSPFIISDDDESADDAVRLSFTVAQIH